MKSFSHFFSKPHLYALAAGALIFEPVHSATPYFETREDLLKHIESKRNFSFDIDQDQNQFPDSWFMESGPSFQTYHSIRTDTSGDGDLNSLKIVFSGGKSGIYSAPIKLDSRYAYNIQLSFKGSSLGEQYSNKLTFGLRAYDKDNNLLENLPNLTEKQFGSDWKRSRILRIERLPEDTHTCSLYVHLSGRPSGRSELHIDQIDIISSPRIHFETKKPLNIYDFDEKMTYNVEIDGTNPGDSYELELEITDFMGNSIEKKTHPFKGDLLTKAFSKTLEQESSGVYNLNAKLMHQGETLLNLKEILARNTPRAQQTPNQGFGVLLGHPTDSFDRLLLSLDMLGTQISKLSMLPEDFKIKSSISSSNTIDKLNPLLLEKAPDNGYQFIGSLDIIPPDTVKDKYNPPKNILDTFNTNEEAWKKTFDRLIFHYGNVLTDWQFGADQVSMHESQLDAVQGMVDYLQDKTKWMEILYPTNQPFDKEGFINNWFVSKNETLQSIQNNLKQNNWKKLVATLQLHSNQDEKPIFVIEDMVKKISFLMAQKNSQGEPLVERLFIDRLTDDQGGGLMNEKYEPQNAYFAAKTMIHWTHGAEFLGSFQHPDKSIQNFVFRRGSQAFAIFWRDSKDKKVKPALYNLGSGVVWMDLMGNRKSLMKGSEGSIMLPLSKTPAFLISPNPQLWETMLSYQLTQSPLNAKVELQDQVAQIKNHFGNEASFEVDIEYPQGWTVETRKFESRLLPQDQASFQLSLSPSAQSPVNTPIPVYTHIDITFNNNNHHVVAYREEVLQSDVKMDMSFFEEGDNLEMVIDIALSDRAPASTSFIASALMPNGETFEAFFRNLQPGQNNSKKIFVLNGKDMAGKNVNLSVKENIGQRYLNADFPIPNF